MYIEPNSVVKLLKNIALDNTYEHTIYFANRTEQYNYFSSKTVRTFDKQSYCRKSKGVLRLEVLADNIYDCNYLMFKNTSYGSKWFYCFITNVEYISNNACYVSYEIDYMQTWFLDCTLKQCFVEREHSVTDNIGDNTLPENVELGGYITTNENKFNLGGNSAVIMVTETISNSSVSFLPPNVYFGMPIPCYLCFLPIDPLNVETSVTKIKIICDEYSQAGKSNSIVSMFVCPNYILENQLQIFVKSNDFDCVSRTLSKTPKNNKLYCYPYCCLVVQTGGQIEELRYELFNGSPKLNLKSTFSASPSIVCTPKSYAGFDIDYTHSQTLKGFPLLAWVTNYYQNWLAQNQSVIRANIESSVVRGVAQAGLGIATTVTTGNPMSAVSGITHGIVSAGTNIYNVLAEKEKHSIIPNQMNGCVDSVDTLAISGDLSIRTYCRCIRPEYIDIIDSYFDRFGYATNRTKVPNISFRRHWNYVKTISCTLEGNAPAEDVRAICNCFDRGITFWKNGDNIGNYNLNNTI